ncbi:MAG: hypothetical protein DRJ38_03250 [Thermoprotei archaeon]|nr:MAG: hypothetical protein DRJ38_03250 [Thermoprotei archaeon]
MLYILFVFALLPLLHIIKEDGTIVKESKIQKSIHKLYAISEPMILKTMDLLVKSKFFTENRLGRAMFKALAKMLWFLPHGVVINYKVVEKIIRKVAESENGHIAIGPCVCKKALGVKEEPYITDLTILYGAEIYKEVLEEEYRELTPEEALKLLKEFEKYGLVHEIFACLNKGTWTFVICNCDPKYCVPTRAYMKVGEGIYPGPYRAVVDPDKCLGIDECGKCLKICSFGAVEERDGKAFVNDKCMGCGLCIDQCSGEARRMIPRENYDAPILKRELLSKIFQVD